MKQNTDEKEHTEKDYTDNHEGVENRTSPTKNQGKPLTERFVKYIRKEGSRTTDKDYPQVLCQVPESPTTESTSEDVGEDEQVITR